ncbi:uncharacterized protein [Triticum aestivum]|uniref:uncharacterized protein n=1 Tax=Triticum aestivum TaxID=4565 RepID=UPI001D01F6EB|nr:uncharacterized protein LOC123190559 [Triticum aestivum]
MGLSLAESGASGTTRGEDGDASLTLPGLVLQPPSPSLDNSAASAWSTTAMAGEDDDDNGEGDVVQGDMRMSLSLTQVEGAQDKEESMEEGFGDYDLFEAGDSTNSNGGSVINDEPEIRGAEEGEDSFDEDGTSSRLSKRRRT